MAHTKKYINELFIFHFTPKSVAVDCTTLFFSLVARFFLVYFFFSLPLLFVILYFDFSITFRPTQTVIRQMCAFYFVSHHFFLMLLKKKKKKTQIFFGIFVFFRRAINLIAVANKLRHHCRDNMQYVLVCRKVKCFFHWHLFVCQITAHQCTLTVTVNT